jgi:N-acetyl-gamma-glutamylphosphate reductase
MTTADKIRRLLAEGKTAKEIAKKLKIKNAYVHTIKWQDKKASDFVSKVFEKVGKAKKLPHPITTPEKMFHDIEDEQAKQEYRVRESLKEWHKEMRSKKPNNWVELPKDHIVGADLVNNPPHYTTGGIDFLDYAEAKGLTENAYLFNVVKYVSRAGKKVGSDPLEDLKKAEFYLKREIAVRERA